MDNELQHLTPRCEVCGGPLTRASTGVLSLSATSRCPDCEQSA